MSAMDCSCSGGATALEEVAALLARNGTANSAADTHAFVNLDINAVIKFSQEQKDACALAHHDPGGMQQRKCNQSHRGSCCYQERIAHLPSKQDDQGRKANENRQPVTDSNATQENARTHWGPLAATPWAVAG